MVSVFETGVPRTPSRMGVMATTHLPAGLSRLLQVAMRCCLALSVMVQLPRFVAAARARACFGTLGAAVIA